MLDSNVSDDELELLLEDMVEDGSVEKIIKDGVALYKLTNMGLARMAELEIQEYGYSKDSLH